MPGSPFSMKRRHQLLTFTLGLGLAGAPAGSALAQEPAALGAGTQAKSVRTDKNPLRARSATENVVFGQIVNTDEHRLTLREGEGDSATETVYRLSPTVRVYSQDRVVDLSELPARTRVRFSRATEPDGEVTDLYTVEDSENTDAAARAAEQTSESKSAVGLGLIMQETDGVANVVGVRPDGPADKAGIKAGDRIVRIDDSVISTPQEVFAATEGMKADQRVTLTVRRDDREQTVSLLAGEGPGARDTIRVTAEPAATRVVVDGDAAVAKNDVTPTVDLGAVLETTPAGVEVVRIDAVSPLADAGLKSGDFIKTAAGQSVVTPDALFRVLNEFDGGATVELSAVRNGSEMDFKLTLPEEHKKVLVDRAEELEGSARNAPDSRRARTTDPRLLQQIRRTQEQQQAQLKYLHDGLMQLAQAAGVNSGVLGNSPYPFGGGVLPIGGFGGGDGTGGNSFPAIGFDANGNPVIGVNQAGTALGVVGFNELGYPILAETTLVTPLNSGNANGDNVTDRNGDGIPDVDLDGDGFAEDYNGDGAPDLDRDGDGYPPQSPPGAGEVPQNREPPQQGEIAPNPGVNAPPEEGLPIRTPLQRSAPKSAPRTPQPRRGQ